MKYLINELQFLYSIDIVNFLKSPNRSFDRNIVNSSKPSYFPLCEI